MSRLFSLLLFAGFLFSGRVLAQTPVDSTTLDPDLKLDTTNAYIDYPQRLFIGYFQSLQRFTVSIEPGSITSPFSHRYTSGNRNVTGIELGYGKLFLSINFRSVKSNSARTGNNDTYNFGFAVGSNKLQFEGLYQRHRGFYDVISPRYSAAYDDPNPYYRKPGFTVNMMRFKTLYFPNHRNLAVKAHQGNNFRQLRSALSPVIAAGFFRTRLKESTGLINEEIASFYGSYAELSSLSANGLTLGGGVAGTFVFLKHFYAGGSCLVYAEPQIRRYQYRNRPDSYDFAGNPTVDVRFTTGFNSEKLYAGLWITNTFSTLNNKSLHVGTNLVAAGFSLAFRIKLNKEPVWVQRIKANKYYRKL